MIFCLRCKKELQEGTLHFCSALLRQFRAENKEVIAEQKPLTREMIILQKIMVQGYVTDQQYSEIVEILRVSPDKFYKTLESLGVVVV